MIAMQNKFSLSIFFPAYNEEENIERTVRIAEDVVRGLTEHYEIIVVNDGSKDKTGEIADRLARENEKVRVIHHDPNLGYGAAVWSGMQAARYEYVFFTDADLQFDLREITKLLQHVPQYDAVLGYRVKRRDPFLRLINAKGWNILNRLLFGLKVKDIDGAFKLFRRSIVADLPVKSRGAMFSAELLIRLRRNGVAFKEVPVTHFPRLKGQPTGAKPSVILRAFKEMLKIYENDLGNQTAVSAVKFGLVGVMNTLVDWTVYFALTRGVVFLADQETLVKTISFLCGTVPSFMANRFWTFNQSSPVRASEIGRFYTTVLSALVINVVALYVLVNYFHLYDLAAVVIATVASFVWNFTLSRTWVFRDRFHINPASQL